MKKILFGLLCMCSLFAQAQEAANLEEEKQEIAPIVAPKSVSFMGRTIHFSYWEIYGVQPYWPNTVVKLFPSPKYKTNAKQIPEIHANYHGKGVTPNTGLGIEDESMTFSTSTNKPIGDYKIKCGDSIIGYDVHEGDISTILMFKFTPDGTITFSGVLKKYTQKEINNYVQAMCREPFPQWLKDVPTVEEINTQTKKEESGKPAAVPVRKPVASKKKAAAKTTVNKLQTVQPTYRSGK